MFRVIFRFLPVILPFAIRFFRSRSARKNGPSSNGYPQG